MSEDISKALKDLEKKKKQWGEVIASTREMTLSNLSMIAQNPAPAFNERKRSEFLLERFVEAGINEPETDDYYNAIGRLNSSKFGRNILITTHMDNQFEESVDQNVSISENRVFGVGVVEDNLALAALCTLPDILRRCGIELNSSISLLASTRSHGRGDFGGIKHYLKNAVRKPDFVISLAGANLGQLDYFTLSRVRCDIRSELNAPPDSAWAKENNNSAIIVTNEIINAILEIPLPRKPRSVVNIGMISGGERYSTISGETTIRLEILSEKDSITDELINKINDRCLDIGARHGVEVTADFFGRHHARGLSCSHPLIKTSIGVLNFLGLRPTMDYSSSDISAPLADEIPSVCLGLTNGVGGNSLKAHIEIEPLNKGLLQLLILICLIDKGLCDE
jgi:acetylornithine deacetylase/succinyl-diaminopimelate desuccinylase-like protein